MKFDLHDDTSYVLLNPGIPETARIQLESCVSCHPLKRHIWIATSGSEGSPKMVALSKDAMSVSAESVNRHLKMTKRDIWLNVLPLFHVGGLATHFRALVSGCNIVDLSDEKWDPIRFVQQLTDTQATFSSLVPTQVWDLVQNKLRPPHSLRGLLVGGAPLSHSLHEKAYSLGWPIYKTYGMTEASSQIATATTPEPGSPVAILDHIAIRTNPEGFIEIKSKALLTGVIHSLDPEKRLIDPKVDGWYTTEDKGHFKDGNLTILGRGSQFLKIGGESVDIGELEKIWDGIAENYSLQGQAVLIDLSDERLGKAVHLAVTKPIPESAVATFNQSVLPIAKIRSIIPVEAIPRSPLGKILKETLRKYINRE